MTNENIKIEDLDIMCRICLQRSDDRIDLFSSLAGYSMISNAVMECAPIQITYGDNLPGTICQSCIVQLDVAYRFRVLCVQSDITLRQLTSAPSLTAVITTDDHHHIINDNNDVVKLEKSDNESSSIHSNYSNHGNNDDDIKDEIEFNDDEMLSTDIIDKSSDDNHIDENNLIDDNDIKLDVKSYLVTKKDKVKKQFSCSNCLSSFKRKDHLKRHQKRCVIDTSTEEGNNIKNTYVSNNSKPTLKIKLKPYATFKENIERDENGRYSCRICNKTYKSKYHTARHAIIHSDYRFRCPHCDKCFVRPASLREHINVHTGKRGYNCEFCGKIFRTDSALNTHRRIHLGVRPYKCDICERTFTQNKTLKNHMRTHTGERPFVCETCGRSFNRKHILKTHTMIHTGERPHRCDLCNRTFICKQHLQLHLIKHTGEPTSSLRCNICDKRFTTHSIKLKHEFDIHQLSSLI